MTMGRNFVPVHPNQMVQKDPLEEMLAAGGGDDEILKLLTDNHYRSDQLLKLAVRDPGLAARLLAMSITARREAEVALESVAVPVAPAESAESAEPKPPRILVVEDDHESRELVGQFLRDQGYEVDLARNGQEALSRFHKKMPDFVLCDVFMPRMNGFKVLLEIKCHAPDLPVLLMTGSNSVSQVFETFRYSNVGFLPKPFRLGDLGERVQSMLGIYR